MPLIWIRKVAWLTKIMATSFAPSVSFSRGTPLFSTHAGHRLRGSRTILRVLHREGAKSFGKVGLKKRLPSK